VTRPATQRDKAKERIVEYQNSKHVSGEAHAAAKRIVTSLTGQGFRIVTQNRDLVELAGPGMTSSRQNPLVGASKVVVRGLGREVTIEADFAAIRRLIRILAVVIFGMAILFCVLFGFVVPFEHPVLRFILPVLPLAPWLFLLPWMGRIFRRRTARAFDTLLESVAA
jgi:hypothetical protein